MGVVTGIVLILVGFLLFKHARSKKARLVGMACLALAVLAFLGVLGVLIRGVLIVAAVVGLIYALLSYSTEGKKRSTA